MPADVRERAPAEDQALVVAEEELPHAFFLSDSDLNSLDLEFFPLVARSHDAEAGGSSQAVPTSIVPLVSEITTSMPPDAPPSEFILILQQMQ